MHLTSFLPRCATILGLSIFLLGCPGPQSSMETLGEVHLLDLDRGKMVAIRETALVSHGEGGAPKNKSVEITTSTLQPPFALASPKAFLVPTDSFSGQPQWAHFLELPEGVPSYVAYRFDSSRRHFDENSRKTGQIVHPGGQISWVPADPSLGFTHLAWGTEAPFLVGYRVEPDGSLSVWPNLPALTAAPVGLALNNDLLCIADAAGKVDVYRLADGLAPMQLHGLSAAGPVRNLAAHSVGLLVLRENPASLDLHALDATGLSDFPQSSIPVVGKALDLGVSGEEILVTSVAPQAITRLALTNGKLEQRGLLVAIRGDFAIHRTIAWPRSYSASRALLDVARGQGAWLSGFGSVTEGFIHFSLPAGHYAPVQISVP